jgi:hypothetical protein
VSGVGIFSVNGQAAPLDISLLSNQGTFLLTGNPDALDVILNSGTGTYLLIGNSIVGGEAGVINNLQFFVTPGKLKSF